MKKYMFYALSLAALTMTACDDESYNDWAQPVQNPQEEYAEGITLTLQPTATVDYATLTDDSVQLFVPTLQLEDADAVLTGYEITMGANTPMTLTASTDGYVSATELSELVVANYGRAPYLREMEATVVAYITSGSLGLKTSATCKVSAQLVAPVIEEAYYLVGTCNGWSDSDQTFKFEHNPANNVYDDPIFTLMFAASVDATTGERVDEWFKIAPASAYTNGNFWGSLLGAEMDGDESTKAALVSTDPQAFCQKATDGAMFYKMQLNMMDYTIEITPLSFEEYIYVPGNHQGWSPETAPALYGPAFDGVYKGFTYLDGDFKFTRVRGWSSEYNSTHFINYTGAGLAPSTDGTNIKASEPGFYMLQVDVQAQSIVATPTAWGLIGSATAGGWDTDTDMTWDATDESFNFTGELAAGEVKFRANDGWDLNFGGALDNLSEGGDNIAIAEAGTYQIKLFLTRKASNQITCTIVKQ